MKTINVSDDQSEDGAIIYFDAYGNLVPENNNYEGDWVIAWKVVGNKSDKYPKGKDWERMTRAACKKDAEFKKLFRRYADE